MEEKEGRKEGKKEWRNGGKGRKEYVSGCVCNC